ncbi:hypothetical protein K9M74_00440 [Candidatus Woesearchaeota archaeon]|nr:hypothetical protein [Candidatus Woesearchaeota archaeon]
MEKIVIDLGKGVVLVAPVKRKMTVDEWKRMSSYVSSLIKDSLLRVK